jgi:hypothetical protein
MNPILDRVAYTIPCIGAPVHSPDGVLRAGDGPCLGSSSDRLADRLSPVTPGDGLGPSSVT